MDTPDVNQPSILLCTPVRGGFSPSYKQSVRALEAWCRTQGIAYDERSIAEAPVEVARDLLAAEFLAAKHDGMTYTHCLMVDAGVGFPVEVIKKMLAADVDFAAAAVPLRQTRADKAAELGDARYASAFSVQFPRETRETGRAKIVNKGGAAFAKIEMIGGALMCLRRNVFLRMYDAYPELAHKTGFAYFQPTLLTEQGESHVALMRTALKAARTFAGRTPEQQAAIFDRIETALALPAEDFDRCGEDVSFCRRWIAMDSPASPAEIWLLCDAPLIHEGHGYFPGNFTDSFD
jgi:hypothetical protein